MVSIASQISAWTSAAVRPEGMSTSTPSVGTRSRRTMIVSCTSNRSPSIICSSAITEREAGASTGMSTSEVPASRGWRTMIGIRRSFSR
jgi:hypothetical protein